MSIEIDALYGTLKPGELKRLEKLHPEVSIYFERATQTLIIRGGTEEVHTAKNF